MAASFPTSVKTFTTKVDGAGGSLVAAADVNDLQLEVAAIETILVPAIDGWTPVSSTWTYASASTITVPAGAAAIYVVGDKIKLTQTTLKFFTVSSVANTTLGIAAPSATLVDAAITSASYSHEANPVGFPAQFSYTPTVTYTGGTADPTSWPTLTGVFSSVGRLATITISGTCTCGSGDRTVIKFSVPIRGYLAYSVIQHSLITENVPVLAMSQVNGSVLEFSLGGAMAVDGAIFTTVNYIMY